MNFVPLIQYLCDLFPEFVMGRNVFVNSMPTDIEGNELQMLFRDVYAGVTVDKDIEDYRHGRFTLAVRGYDYAHTRQLAREISKALTIYAQDIGDMEVKLMRPLNEPVGFMPSVGGYWEFSVNYTTYYAFLAEEPEEEVDIEDPEPTDPQTPDEPINTDGGG